MAEHKFKYDNSDPLYDKNEEDLPDWLNNIYERYDSWYSDKPVVSVLFYDEDMQEYVEIETGLKLKLNILESFYIEDGYTIVYNDELNIITILDDEDNIVLTYYN